MLLSLLKPRYRLTTLAIVTSVIAVVLGSDNGTGSDGDFRRQLPEVLDLLCPYGTTCRGGEARLQLNKNKESCCTECSCEDSCGLTVSCCYPEQAVLNHFDRSHQQCQVASSKIMDPMRWKKHLYMVTSGFGNGSGDDCGNGNATCGENETASALGSTYPVSSKTTGIIYKNKQCARCHGVVRGDMVPWEAVMTCLSGEGRVETVLQSLETGRVHASCYLDFYYPGPQSDINVHVCYENTRRRCRHYEGRPYYLPSYLNMTDDEVRTACLNGPQARYQDYYNLFCYLCSYRRYNAGDQCANAMEDLGDRAPFTGTFSAVLGLRYLEHEAKRTEKESKVQVPFACKRKDEVHIDENDCRLAFCPSGKLRNASACDYPTTTLFSRNFEVAIKLYPRGNMAISPLIDQIESYLQQDKDWRAYISAPGLNAWRLSILCYHADTRDKMNNASTGFFWLKLSLEMKKAPSLSRILANVNKVMTGNWEFLDIMTSVPLEQRFAEFEDVRYYTTTNTFKPHYTSKLDPDKIPAASRFDWPEMSCTALDYSDYYAKGIGITKTFFCDQVALRPGEYVMDKMSKVLYVNATGRVFSPAEYALGYNARGDPEPRLCLVDTEYVLAPQQKSASPSAAAHKNWLILALVVIIELF